MEMVLGAPTVDSFGQPSGELIGTGELIKQMGGEPVAAVAQGHSAGEGAIVVGPLAISVERVSKRRHQITARRLDGDLITVDTIEPGRAGQRQRFIEQVLEKLGFSGPDADELETGLDQPLLQIASSPATPPVPSQAAAAEPEFRVVAGAGDPELDGIYATMPPGQIANFDMRILEHIVVEDEDRPETRLRLVIRRRAREHEFEMNAAEFASNGKLRTAIYSSALPGADLKAGADVLRRAVTALSDPAIRRMTTSTGWTADQTRFLVPGGFVDVDGYHPDDPTLDVPQVDRAGCEGASGWDCSA
jgi:hypothetical protein